MLTIKWLEFGELTSLQLYAILQLRAEVFVVEQNCAYLDPDGRDLGSMHLLISENDVLNAYLRLYFKKGSPNLFFGRVITSPRARGKGLAKLLMQELLTYCHTHFPNHAIECSAQFYLQQFYENVGFKTVGTPYDEDGIPHIKMVLDSNSIE